MKKLHPTEIMEFCDITKTKKELLQSVKKFIHNTIEHDLILMSNINYLHGLGAECWKLDSVQILDNKLAIGKRRHASLPWIWYGVGYKK